MQAPLLNLSSLASPRLGYRLPPGPLTRRIALFKNVVVARGGR